MVFLRNSDFLGLSLSDTYTRLGGWDTFVLPCDNGKYIFMLAYIRECDDHFHSRNDGKERLLEARVKLIGRATVSDPLTSCRYHNIRL